jgi:hypothetical protein
VRARITIALVMLLLVSATAGGALARASSRAVTQIRAVYRAVLSAEYFGPAKAVCSRLTPAAVRSFTAGGRTTCKHAFRQDQRALARKSKNVDNSGYTRAEWRAVIAAGMAHLKVRVHGSRATATGGESGIPGEVKLVRVKGRWLVNGHLPSIGP